MQSECEEHFYSLKNILCVLRCFSVYHCCTVWLYDKLLLSNQFRNAVYNYRMNTDHFPVSDIYIQNGNYLKYSQPKRKIGLSKTVMFNESSLLCGCVWSLQIDESHCGHQQGRSITHTAFRPFPQKSPADKAAPL